MTTTQEKINDLKELFKKMNYRVWKITLNNLEEKFWELIDKLINDFIFEKNCKLYNQYLNYLKDEFIPQYCHILWFDKNKYQKKILDSIF